VGGYLPKGYAASVDRQLAKAFADTDPERGLKVAKGIAAQLDERYPSAAASLREGLTTCSPCAASARRPAWPARSPAPTRWSR